LFIVVSLKHVDFLQLRPSTPSRSCAVLWTSRLRRGERVYGAVSSMDRELAPLVYSDLFTSKFAQKLAALSRRRFCDSYLLSAAD